MNESLEYWKDRALKAEHLLALSTANLFALSCALHGGELQEPLVEGLIPGGIVKDVAFLWLVEILRRKIGEDNPLNNPRRGDPNTPVQDVRG